MHLQKLAILTFCLMSLISTGDGIWHFTPENPPANLVRSGIYETVNVPGKTALHGACYHAGRLAFLAPHSPAVDLTDDFSIEAVFCPKSVDSYRTILWKGDRSTYPQQIQYYVSVFNGRLEFKYKKANGDWVVHMTRQAVIVPDLWYHACIRIQHGFPQFWINGKQYPNAGKAQQATSPVTLVSNDKPVMIGNGHNGSTMDYHFDGVIREIAMSQPASKTVMKQDDISDLMREGYDVMDQHIQDLRKQLEEEINQLSSQDASRKAAHDIMQTAKRFLDFLKANELAEASKAYHAFMPRYQHLRRIHAKRLNAHRNRMRFQAIVGKKDIGLATLPTAQGYKQGEAISALLQEAREISRSAARGEVESFQLLVIGGRKDGTATIRVSSLKDSQGHALPPETISWGLIEDITAHQTMLGTNTHEKARYIGSWPDLVRDGNPSAIPFKASKPTFIFMRLSVPLDAVPGDYTGVVSVTASQTVCELPIRLRIWPFALPTRNSLPVAFSFFNHFYQKWYGLKSLSADHLERINRFLMAYRLAPNNIYSKEVFPTIADQKAYGLNFSTVGYFFFKKPLTETKLTQLMDQYRPRLKAMKEAGLEQNAYLYAFDEIVGMYPSQHRNTFAAARQVMTRFKQEFPWLKRLQTSVPNNGLQGVFDIWCPLFNYFAPGDVEAQYQRKQNTTFWWYAADSPVKPYPNFFLGYPLNDLRVIMTLTYQYRIKGVLYWCINREWDTNRMNRKDFENNSKVWKPYIVNVFTKKEVKRNGMGNLTYPGPEGRILPSLRLENLRDGIEDYELYTLLERQIEHLKQMDTDTARKLLKMAQETLAVPPTVAVDITRYSEAPQPLMDHHDRVGEMIARIHRFLQKH